MQSNDASVDMECNKRRSSGTLVGGNFSDIFSARRSLSTVVRIGMVTAYMLSGSVKMFQEHLTVMFRLT